MRYSIVSSISKIEHGPQAEFEMSFSPIYHARPGMQLPVIVENNEKKYIVKEYHWGLAPQWFRYKNNLQRLTTAWVGGLVKGGYYKKPIRKQRCLIPVNCPILHIQTDMGKWPYAFYLKNQKLFSIAGLWDCWQDKTTGGPHNSFSVIENVAPRRLKNIIQALPVVVPHGHRRRFLGPTTPLSEAMRMLAPFESGFYNLGTFAARAK